MSEPDLPCDVPEQSGTRCKHFAEVIIIPISFESLSFDPAPAVCSGLLLLTLIGVFSLLYHLLCC